MKTLKFFFGVLATVALSFATVTSASAQECEKEGRNWFVGAGAGVNFFGDGAYKPSTGVALDLNVGKWLTNSLGIRVGYVGLTGSEWAFEPTVLGPAENYNESKGMYKEQFGFAYAHADFMLNLTNAFGGYKADRFWNCTPYLHVGYLRTYDRANAAEFASNDLGYGAGLLNSLRLTDRLDLTIDIRGLLMDGKHHGYSGTAGLIQTAVGVSVDLCK